MKMVSYMSVFLSGRSVTLTILLGIFLLDGLKCDTAEKDVHMKKE